MHADPETLFSPGPRRLHRRGLLQAVAGLAVGPAAAALLPASAVAASTPRPVGKPGDFDFLAGEWRISHRRRKGPGSQEWDVFDGEATCWSILRGVGSIEELRVPARGFIGLGLRLLDVEGRVWSDYWVNGRSGVLTTPGATGVFEDGVGTFLADDVDGDRPITVRGVWDRITPASCRWRQEISRDGGKVWQEDWSMDWVRVA